MQSHVLAKIMGWLQFGMGALGQVTQSGGTPHGWAAWLTMLASLGAAIGIHASSNTDGTK